MSNNLTFRKAKIADLPAIIKMMADDVLGKTREDFRLPLPDFYLQAFEEIQEDKNSLLIVVDLAEQKNIATMHLYFMPALGRKGKKRMQIEAVRVNKDLRGQGIGEEMIKWAIGKAKENNCGLIQLTTDKERIDAHRFYERLGFKPSHLGMKLEL